ncbi:hypothetical protein L596_006965 [Steinernema carpocapsae]|uniref:Uncharacterized protein n=1 Tax=Steinernema carpocapsae TaxID=34508 RepID=A0A4U5P881_STECR|nr:hypothetical protein L596_006965 [Steinernema carpocapsae]
MFFGFFSSPNFHALLLKDKRTRRLIGRRNEPEEHVTLKKDKRMQRSLSRNPIPRKEATSAKNAYEIAGRSHALFCPAFIIPGSN